MIASGQPSLSLQMSATRTRPMSGRDDGEVAQVELVLEVVQQHRHREEVVDRPVEEALDLRGVQVDGHDPVGAGRP